jgi:SAM-dependent methyltransferase
MDANFLAQGAMSLGELTEVVAGELTAEYGNWVSRQLVYVPALVGLGFITLSVWSIVFAIPAAVLILVAAYFAYARYLFAPHGGRVQDLIWTNLLDHLEWDGRGQALDIGCGNGALAIRLARKYTAAKVAGIDHWGKQWEYSKALCERNATIEGVGERLTFQQASASSLPFPDESFDLVVSNLTFHEVKDAADKRLLIKEALRVLRSGGVFAFQDLFLSKRVYGDVGALLVAIRSWGAEKVEFVDTHNAPFIPWALKLPFMVGTMGLVVGAKMIKHDLAC